MKNISKEIIVCEIIEVDCNGEYLIEADPRIIMEMREKINKKTVARFSYKEELYISNHHEDERRLRMKLGEIV